MRIVLFCALAAALTSWSDAVHADELDGWCDQAKKTSSVIICSDPELRQQAAALNKLFEKAR
jgi:uncharacterized protein YecT (DUF1311 family)